jgi:hypothetical protein
MNAFAGNHEFINNLGRTRADLGCTVLHES